MEKQRQESSMTCDYTNQKKREKSWREKNMRVTHAETSTNCIWKYVANVDNNLSQREREEKRNIQNKEKSLEKCAGVSMSRIQHGNESCRTSLE